MLFEIAQWYESEWLPVEDVARLEQCSVLDLFAYCERRKRAGKVFRFRWRQDRIRSIHESTLPPEADREIATLREQIKAKREQRQGEEQALERRQHNFWRKYHILFQALRLRELAPRHFEVPEGLFES